MIANSLITSMSTGLIIAASVLATAVRAEEKALTPQAKMTDEAPTIDQVKGAALDGRNVPSGAMLSLGKIDAEVENDLTIVTAKLNGHPTWKVLEIEEHGTFLQIKMPGTIVANSGEFSDGTGPYLKKIASFQVGDSDGALRLFLNQDAAKAKLATTAELIGERVIVTIDHKKLEQLIEPKKSSPAEGQDIALLTKGVVMPNGEHPKLDLLTSKGKEATVSASLAPKMIDPDSEKSGGVLGSGPEGLNLKDKLMTAAAFCAAMLLFLVGSAVWRNKKIVSRRRSKQFENIEPVAMKILSNLSISGRQRLSLVQVGSKQILIGISPESISFLTEVQTQQKQQPSHSFASQLLQETGVSDIKLKQADASAQQRQVKRPVDLATAPRPQVRPKQITQPNRVNIGVGDDGVSDLRSRGIKNDQGPVDQPYDDITKMIRNRLKNMPHSS
ncbi:MAG: flagellar biosynthetic protein FliO [Proteobacteria bacterium]|nr:flagellar biosynthetic protein FliO [Pseudomonadota bacterium]